MNRSSSPKGAAPRTTKPVHVRGESLAEAPAAFLRDDEGAPARMPVKTPNMPMFAPVTGPRLTPEEAPGKPSDWTPLKERDSTFDRHNKPDLDRKDPWQFKNFLIQNAD